eukprot:6084605-Amphidinium_carterae.1
MPTTGFAKQLWAHPTEMSVVHLQGYERHVTKIKTAVPHSKTPSFVASYYPFEHQNASSSYTSDSWLVALHMKVPMRLSPSSSQIVHPESMFARLPAADIRQSYFVLLPVQFLVSWTTHSHASLCKVKLERDFANVHGGIEASTT